MEPEVWRKALRAAGEIDEAKRRLLARESGPEATPDMLARIETLEKQVADLTSAVVTLNHRLDPLAWRA